MVVKVWSGWGGVNTYKYYFSNKLRFESVVCKYVYVRSGSIEKLYGIA